ncbi:MULTISPECIES: hypothetical protein [Lactobacillales]|uniref:Uncharacterized protein n=1 Tax=Ligilactobacillus salivarius TaxID=1624 RepID=A0A1V9RBD2_9LACO|nr:MULTISPECIES: hypothetical protein [Lactobacillales]PEH09947.1 hypothetical protein CP353_05905 [Lactobacillus sp. UMNPBX2]AYC11611.1 hypothetical protein LS1_01659 [Ligilactobacillus salivarius]MBE5066740.1 hypothetical protein [Ligilactobacillus salivarius]MBZ4031104.1 hypothetical protein [Ligilactobacillus salivarius]MDM8284417.1 hypothetical protein [Ligilactobacillus salivarius]
MKVLGYIAKISLPFFLAYVANVSVAEAEMELLAKRIIVFFTFMLSVAFVIIFEFMEGDK